MTVWALHWGLWLGQGSPLSIGCPCLPMVGWGHGRKLGLLDTCPLTDGPQSGGGVLSSPTQALSGVGQGHLPHCNAQLPNWPRRGPGWPPTSPACGLCTGGEKTGLALGSTWQSWDKDVGLFPPTNSSGFSTRFFLPLLSWPAVWFQDSASEHMLPTSLRVSL